MKNYRLIGLERRGALFFGLILKQEQDKQEVYLETGEKVLLGISKTIYSFSTTVAADNEKNMKLGLKAIKEKFSEGNLDLAMLWECIEEETPYLFTALLESYFSEKKDINAGYLFVTLMEDKHYFQYKNGFFFKVASKIVTENLRREQSEQERRSTENGLLEWIKENKTEHFDPTSEEGSRLLEVLKRYALEGEEKATSEAKRLANLFGLTPDEFIILLEQKGLLDKDINETVFRFGIPYVFPPSVLAESERILTQAPRYGNRPTVTHPWSVAIDDAETTEVDDALSYAYEEGYHVVGIHIADPSFTIERNTELDQFACDRFSTIYFPDERMFLFPSPLIQERMTLAAGQARPAISAFFYFNEEGDCVKHSFGTTLFTLCRRATYEETEGPLGEEPEYRRLEKIALRLRAQRQEKGAVVSDLPDIKIKVTEGEVTISKIPFVSGHLVVSELMILFNGSLAQYFASQGLPAFYRIQSAPIHPIDVAPDDPLYSLKIRWALTGASLSLTPGPHYTLGLPAYVQGSSPIRRYSDLVMHRQLVALLEGKPLPYSDKELTQIKVLSERMERAIKAAEYSRYMFWLLKYLKKNKGKVYEALVSRILENNRLMVFIPDLMQEFPFKAVTSNLEVGSPILLRVQGSSPRKKRARFEKVSYRGEPYAPREAEAESEMDANEEEWKE